MSESRVKISIVFPSFNGEEVIYNNLKSIQKLSNLNEIELIIIDNNSNDSTIDIIKSFKDIKINLIEQKENLGFAKACNIGVKKSKGEYIFITNQDVTFPRDFFTNLITIYREIRQKEAKDFFLCPAVVFSNMMINYFGAKIHFLGFSYTTNMYQIIPKKKSIFKTQKISGVSMFLKKKIFLEFNGFDSIFFMYQEDTDLSLKALRNQVNVYTTNRTLLHHQKEHLLLNNFTYYYIERNRYLCLLKNYKDLKNLVPYIIISEIILLFQAFLIKKLKIRFKIYKFFIQNNKLIHDLRFKSNNCSSPKIRKQQLSSNLDIVLFKELRGNIKLFKILIRILNLIF